jgi:serine/threonine protein kinase/tetratricopeptide (TPR) repeat protein
VNDFGPRFHVRRPLGEGGFGAVYEVFDTERDAVVALKTMWRLDAASLYRFKQEFRTLSELRHPHLARLHELFADGDQWFFTMERVQGVDWLDYVSNVARERGPVELALEATELAPLASAAEAAPNATVHGPHPSVTIHGRANTRSADLTRLRRSLAELASVLGLVHEHGIVHRDVKPANVLVTEDGRLVLLDFGIATRTAGPGASLGDADGIVGTPAYMAPEQLLGEPLTAACDWYAVGTMLFEALTGELPFSGSVGAIVTAKLGAKEPSLEAWSTFGAEALPADLVELASALLRRDPVARAGLDEVLRVVGGLPTARSRSQAPLRGEGFVGREVELARLRTAFDRARAETPSLIVLDGPSGIGKSAVARAFARSLPREVLRLEGRSFQRELVPFKALDGAFDALSRHLLSLSELEVQSLLPRRASLLGQLFPVLGRVPAIAKAPRAAGLHGDLRERSVEALRELLARICDRVPVMVVLDDVQWGDVDSARLLAEVLSPPDPVPLFVVMTRRPDDPGAGVFLSALDERLSVLRCSARVETVRIDPLSEADAQALAARISDGALAPREVDAVVRDAGGQPFLLCELARAVDAAGAPSVDALVERRVAELSDLSRTMLSLLAAAERSVATAQLESLLAGAGAAVLESVHELCDARLARRCGLRGELVEPYHDRVREPVIARLGVAERRALHGQLLALFAETDGVAPDTVYRHAREAGESTAALHWGERAAREAIEAFALDHALQILEELLQDPAVDASSRLRLGLSRVDALERAGRYAAALEVGESLLPALDRGADGARAAQLRITLASAQAQLGTDDERAGTWLREAAIAAKRAGDETLATTAWGRLVFLTSERLRRPEATAALRAEGAALLGEIADPLALAGLRQSEARALVRSGDAAGARAAAEEALALREAALGPDHLDVAESRNGLGVVLCELGDPRAGLPELERALAIREGLLGAEHPVVTESLNNLGKALALAGEHTRAVEVQERAIALKQRLPGDSSRLLGYSLTNLGEAVLETGDAARAVEILSRALALKERSVHVEHPELVSTTILLARAQVAGGELDAARSGLARAARVLAKNTNVHHEALLLHARVELAVAEGAPQRAEELLARPELRGLMDRRPELQLLEAEVLWRVGSFGVARTRAESARAAFAAAGHASGEARAAGWLAAHS